jgi:hypothetical protein
VTLFQVYTFTFPSNSSNVCLPLANVDFTSLIKLRSGTTDDQPQNSEVQPTQFEQFSFVLHFELHTMSFCTGQDDDVQCDQAPNATDCNLDSFSSTACLPPLDVVFTSPPLQVPFRHSNADFNWLRVPALRFLSIELPSSTLPGTSKGVSKHQVHSLLSTPFPTLAVSTFQSSD